MPDYERVVGRVIDALGAARIGLVGLSLGGYFAARAAALEPRVAAVATVSGPFHLDWEELPPAGTGHHGPTRWRNRRRPRVRTPRGPHRPGTPHRGPTAGRGR
uniref:alpha/beta fold hydrolase n=1 Tax=Streptomyces sp. NBC_01592 TaxID=2975889 RepID=UPI003BADBDD7